MKTERIPMLLAALFAAPVFAQPLSLEDVASADMKAQVYESQMAETSGASTSIQTDQGGSDNGVKQDAAAPAKEAPEVAVNDHAGISTEHPQKPAAKPEPHRVHVVRHLKKKAN